MYYLQILNILRRLCTERSPFICFAEENSVMESSSALSKKTDLSIIRNTTGVILRNSSVNRRIEAHPGTPDIRQPFRHLRQKLHPP